MLMRDSCKKYYISDDVLVVHNRYNKNFFAYPIAFFRALSKAETRLLEPEMSFELFCDQKKIPTVIKGLSKYSVASFVETKLQQACVSGTAPLSVSKDFPCMFMQLLGGGFFILSTRSGICKYS